MGLLLALVAVFVVSSCKKKDDTYDMGYAYFPLNQGHYVIYSVREVYVDQPVQIRDTFDYFLKTVIAGNITDNSGRTVQQYERYYGPSANGPWSIHDVWTAVNDGSRAELVEENNRTIKLVFAPSEDDEWNMNAYNTLDEMECYYSNINGSYTLGSQTFSATVTVEQEDFSSYIDSRRKYEVYAKGIGLVHKYYRDFIINNGNPNSLKKGRLLEMKLVSYGN